jgi:Na+(H+)/acetate symporter ActP
MNKKDMSIAGCFGIIFTLLVVIICSPIMNGWVLSVLWGWFIVPIFNAPQLSIPYAIGISFIIHMLTNKQSDTTNNKDKDVTTIIIEALVSTFITPLLVLLFGWIVTLFM